MGCGVERGATNAAEDIHGQRGRCSHRAPLQGGDRTGHGDAEAEAKLERPVEQNGDTSQSEHLSLLATPLRGGPACPALTGGHPAWSLRKQCRGTDRHRQLQRRAARNQDSEFKEPRGAQTHLPHPVSATSAETWGCRALHSPEHGSRASVSGRGHRYLSEKSKLQSCTAVCGAP